MNLRRMFAGSVVAIAAVAASPSYAADFTFSFDSSPGAGNASATVTGTLFGLADNATSRPTDVTVQFAGVTYTKNTDNIFGNGAGFTVSNGVVTGAAYQVLLNPSGNLNLGLNGFNQLITSSNTVVLDGGGFSTIRFSAVTSAVPEPASWAMMLVGFGAIGGAARSRRRGARVSLA